MSQPEHFQNAPCPPGAIPWVLLASYETSVAYTDADLTRLVKAYKATFDRNGAIISYADYRASIEALLLRLWTMTPPPHEMGEKLKWYASRMLPAARASLEDRLGIESKRFI